MILHYKDINIIKEKISFKKKIHLSNDFSFILLTPKKYVLAPLRPTLLPNSTTLTILSLLSTKTYLILILLT